jgi:hypothetical protein
VSKDPNIEDYLETPIIELAKSLRDSIIESAENAAEDEFITASKFKVSDQTSAMILEHAIFLEYFLIRNALFTLGQNEQHANGIVEPLLFRMLVRAFPAYLFPPSFCLPGGAELTELTQHGMRFIDYLTEAEDIIGESLWVDSVVRRFVITINKILGVRLYGPLSTMFSLSTGGHIAAGAKAKVYPEIAKLLANRAG